MTFIEISKQQTGVTMEKQDSTYGTHTLSTLDSSTQATGTKGSDAAVPLLSISEAAAWVSMGNGDPPSRMVSSPFPTLGQIQNKQGVTVDATTDLTCRGRSLTPDPEEPPALVHNRCRSLSPAPSVSSGDELKAKSPGIMKPAFGRSRTTPIRPGSPLRGLRTNAGSLSPKQPERRPTGVLTPKNVRSLSPKLPERKPTGDLASVKASMEDNLEDESDPVGTHSKTPKTAQRGSPSPSIQKATLGRSKTTPTQLGAGKLIDYRQNKATTISMKPSTNIRKPRMERGRTCPVRNNEARSLSPQMPNRRPTAVQIDEQGIKSLWLEGNQDEGESSKLMIRRSRSPQRSRSKSPNRRPTAVQIDEQGIKSLWLEGNQDEEESSKLVIRRSRSPQRSQSKSPLLGDLQKPTFNRARTLPNKSTGSRSLSPVPSYRRTVSDPRLTGTSNRSPSPRPQIQKGVSLGNLPQIDEGRASTSNAGVPRTASKKVPTRGRGIRKTSRSTLSLSPTRKPAFGRSTTLPEQAPLRKAPASVRKARSLSPIDADAPKIVLKRGGLKGGMAHLHEKTPQEMDKKVQATTVGGNDRPRRSRSNPKLIADDQASGPKMPALARAQTIAIGEEAKPCDKSMMALSTGLRRMYSDGKDTPGSSPHEATVPRSKGCRLLRTNSSDTLASARSTASRSPRRGRRGSTRELLKTGSTPDLKKNRERISSRGQDGSRSHKSRNARTLSPRRIRSAEKSMDSNEQSVPAAA